MKLLWIFYLLMQVTLVASAQQRTVLITAGQSNAEGRESMAKLPTYLHSDKYRHLRYAFITDSARTRFRDRQLLQESHWAFQDVCNYLIDCHTSQNFYAIKCTYGGTAIALNQTPPETPTWNASPTYLDTAKAYRGHLADGKAFRCGNSLAKSFSEGFSSLVDGELSKIPEGYDVKAIMWHQGESDRNAAGAYYDNLKTLIAYMRNAIYERTGDPKDKALPIIMGTQSHDSQQYNPIVEKAQYDLVCTDPNVYMIDMSRATLKDDHLHFDSLSTEYLGRAMYDKLIELGIVSESKIGKCDSLSLRTKSTLPEKCIRRKDSRKIKE